MAFPTPINSANTAAGFGSTAITVNMPASIVAGRLLLAWGCPGAAITSLTASAEWTQIGSTIVGGSYKIFVWGKAAAGGDTLTLTRGSANGTIVLVRQIDTWSGSLSDITLTGATASADPPSQTPAGGAKDYLWIAGRVVTGSTAATGAPTNYTDLVSNASATTGSTLDTASRQFNASTENPGTFTGGSTTGPSSFTLSIAPGVSTVTGNFLPFF